MRNKRNVTKMQILVL